MKFRYLILLNICFLFLIVSCKKTIEEDKSPVGIDFSCQINGKHVTMQSPVQGGGEKRFIQRLNKIKNSLVDSTLLAYENSFLKDSFQITIGFSKIILADTTHNAWEPYTQTFKNQIYTIGSIVYRYQDPQWNRITSTVRFTGFYIKIDKIKEGISYTSYLNQVTDLSTTKYNEFKANTSCRITKSTAIQTGIYSNSANAWYIESSFECKLYENGRETNNSIRLTVGSLKCVL